MSNTALSFQLIVHIDADQLLVKVMDGGEKINFNGLEDLTAKHRGAKTITLETRDFYHNGTIYEVYGAVLQDDYHTIHEYWQRNDTQTGIHHEFTIPRHGEGKPPAILIGARPTIPGVPYPKPTMPGGGFPGAEGEEQGPGGDE